MISPVVLCVTCETNKSFLNIYEITKHNLGITKKDITFRAQKVQSIKLPIAMSKKNF